MKIVDLTRAFEDGVQTYNRLPPGSPVPASLSKAQKDIKEYVEDLLRKARTTSNPNSHEYQQVLLELTYFNTRAILSDFPIV